MRDIYQHYCAFENSQYPKVAHFLTIYIEEAHPIDEWYLPHVSACLKQHRSIEERVEAAKLFVKNTKFESELICDSFDNEVNLYFDTWPERLYIIQDGVVVYQGGYGPFNYKLDEVKEWLAKRFGVRGESSRSAH